MADLGEGTLCPLLFLDQTEAQRAKKIFWGGTGPPLSKVLDAPPPSQGLDLALPLLYIQRVVLEIKDMCNYTSILDYACLQISPFKTVIL